MIEAEEAAFTWLAGLANQVNVDKRGQCCSGHRQSSGPIVVELVQMSRANGWGLSELAMLANDDFQAIGVSLLANR